MSQKILNKILILLICVVPLLYIPFSFNLDFSSTMLKVCVIYICTIIMLFLCYKIGYKKIGKTEIFLLIFYFLNLLSLCFSMNRELSVTGLTSSERYDGIIMLGAYILIYYVSKYYFKPSKIDVPLFFISGTIICLIGLYQFLTFTQTNPLLPYTESVMYSTLGNSNFVGSYLTLFIPGLITMYFLKGKFRYLALSTIFIITLVLSTARSAWIGIAFFLIFLIIFLIKNFEKKQIKNYIILITLFIIICTFAICFEQVTGNHILSHKVNSLIQDIKSFFSSGISLEMGTARIKIWNMVIDVVKSKPILGTGPETLPLALAEYSYDDFSKWIVESHTYIDKAHNDYLQIAACTGIPSLIVYLIFLVLALKDNFRNMFKSKISLIFFGSLLAYIIQAFFNISVVAVAPVFWFMLGISQNKDVHSYLEERYKK